MAKQVKKLNVDLTEVGSGRNTSYPWDEWTDGNLWVAEKGTDYDKASAFRSTITSAAKRFTRTLELAILDKDGQHVKRGKVDEDGVAVAFRFGAEGSRPAE